MTDIEQPVRSSTKHISIYLISGLIYATLVGMAGTAAGLLLDPAAAIIIVGIFIGATLLLLILSKLLNATAALSITSISMTLSLLLYLIFRILAENP